MSTNSPTNGVLQPTNGKTNGKQASTYKPCSIRLLPREQWIAAAKSATAVNPSNAPALHQFRQALPGVVLPP